MVVLIFFVVGGRCACLLFMHGQLWRSLAEEYLHCIPFFPYYICRFTFVRIRCITRVDQQLALDSNNTESLELQRKMYTIHPFLLNAALLPRSLCPSLPVYVWHRRSRILSVSRSIRVSSLPGLHPYWRVAVESLLPICPRC
jgi:hypothetical protein